MYFLIEDHDLLQKYNTALDLLFTISALILKENLIANLSTIKKILKTNLKSYSDEIIDFHDKQIRQEGSDYTCLAVITVNSPLKKDKNYYLQVFSKECKYTEKEK